MMNLRASHHAFFLVAIVIGVGSATSVEASPVLYWTFDNTVDDAMGGAAGVLNGGAGYSTTVPGPLTYSTASLDLNSADLGTDWFSVPAALSVQGSYTISAWTRMSSTVGNRSFFDTRSGGNTYDAKFGSSPVTGNPAIHRAVGRGPTWIDTGADADFAAAADTWYHVAAVVDQLGYRIYIDGEALPPVPDHGTFSPPDNPMLLSGTGEINIGRYSGGSEYFSGQIDDVAVWDAALSANNISQLATGTLPTDIIVDVVEPPHIRNDTGALKYLPITGDGDSQIAATKVYTHKLDFGTSGAAVVNGVAFDQGEAGDFATYSSDIPTPHGGNAVSVTGDVAGVFGDMNYNNAGATLTLKGLTVGQPYDTRLYMRSWSQPSDRTQTFEFDVDGDLFGDRFVRINADDAAPNATAYAPGFANGAEAYALSYNFVAESSEMSILIKQLGGGSFHLYGVTNEETDRRPIDSLFSTGLSADGVALAGGEEDPHYTLVGGPQGEPGQQALAITNHPAWAFNDDGSGFIGLVEPGTSDLPDGTYTYSTTFDLAGMVPETAEILMSLIVDNEISDVRLNGVSTGIQIVDEPAHLAQYFKYETSGTFLLDSGFQEGINTLEFDLLNPAIGPAGLRIEMSGSAVPVPEPSVLALALAGLLAAFAYCRRRSS